MHCLHRGERAAIGRYRHREGPDGRGWQEDRQQEDRHQEDGAPRRATSPTSQGHSGSKKDGSKKGGAHKKGDQADVQGHIVARNTHAKGADPSNHAR